MKLDPKLMIAPEAAGMVDVIIRVPGKHRLLRYLKQLVETGLYGDNEAQAAQRLVESGIEELLAAGILERE